MAGLDDPLFRDPLEDSRRSPSNDPYFDGVDIDNSVPRVSRSQNQSVYIPPPPVAPQPQPQYTEPQPEYDPNSIPLYRRYKSFKDAKDKMDAVHSDTVNRSQLSELDLDKFYNDSVIPAYQNYLGSEEVPLLKNDERTGYLQDIVFKMEGAQKRVADGESFFSFGKDEEYESAKLFASPERLNTLKNLRKQEERLLQQRDFYNKRKLDTEINHRRFRALEASIPGIIKSQSEAWIKDAEAKARKKQSDFPDFDPFFGDVRGQGVPKRSGKSYDQWQAEYKAAQKSLDAKYLEIDPTGSISTEGLSHTGRVRLRKQLDLLMGEREEARQFKNYDGLFSKGGMIGGHPVGMTENERFVLDLDLLRKAGITEFKGKPIEQVIQESGGEEKITSLSMISNVLKAHALYTELGVQTWKNWGKPGHDERLQAKNMAYSTWQETLGRAEAVGLGSGLIKRKTSEHWLGDLYKVGQALYKGAIRGYDREEGTPRNLLRIIAGDGGIDDSAISKLVESAKAELNNPRQKDTENYLKLLEDPSKDPIEAFNKMFGDEYEGSAAVVMAELFSESMGSLIPAFLKNLMDVGPYMIGASLIESLLTKKPNKTLGKVFGRNFRLGAAGSFGLASFQLSYIGQVLEDLSSMGVDINNPEHFAAAWSNPEIMEKMRKKAVKYAGGVAFWDTVSGLFVGRISSALSKPSQMLGLSRGGQAILNSSAEILAGAGAGMAGEATGFFLSREEGEQTPWDDIFIEGAIEFGPGSAGAVIGTGRAIFKDQKIQDAWEKNTPRKPKDIVDDIEEDKVVSPPTRPADDGSSFNTVRSAGREYNSLTMAPGSYGAFSDQLAESGYEMTEQEAVGVKAILDNIVYSQESRIDADKIHFVFNQHDKAATFRQGEKGEAFFFLNLEKIKTFELGIVDAFLHESNHLAEKFLLDEGVVESFYEMLTDEQKEAAINEYANKNSSADRRKAAYDRLKANKALARSEWLAMQMSRVLRGDDLSMEPKLKSEIKKVIKILKELVKNIFSVADLAPGQKGSQQRIDFEQYLLDRLNFTERVESTPSSVQPMPEQSPATQPVPEAKPEPKPESKPEPKPKPSPSPKPSSEAKPKASAETKKPKAKTEPKKETPKKTEPKKAETPKKTEAKAKPEPKKSPYRFVKAEDVNDFEKWKRDSAAKVDIEADSEVLIGEDTQITQKEYVEYVSDLINNGLFWKADRKNNEVFGATIAEKVYKEFEKSKPNTIEELSEAVSKEPKAKAKPVEKKPVPKTALQEGLDLVAGGMGGFAAYTQVIQGRNLTNKDAENLLNDLIKAEQARLTDLDAPEIVGRRPASAYSDSLDIETIVKMTQLFRLLGVNSRPLDTLSKNIIKPFILPALKQGKFFKAGSDQFIVDKDGIRFAGNPDDYFSDQSPELEGFDSSYLKESDPPKFKSANITDERQARREALLYNLSKKNLAVALLDPEFFQNVPADIEGNNRSSFNVNLKSFQSDLQYSVKQAKELKKKQDSFLSILHDFRTVFLSAQLAQSTSSSLPSQYKKLMDEAFKNLNNLGLLNKLSGSLKSDGTRDRQDVFATIIEGVIHPGMRDDLAKGVGPKLEDTKVTVDKDGEEVIPESFAMNLNGGLGFDLYLDRVAKFLGIPVVHKTYPNREKELKAKSRDIKTDVVKTKDTSKQTNTVVRLANDFIARLENNNPKFKDESHINKLKRFYISVLNPSSASDAFGKPRSSPPNKLMNRGRFIAFTKSLKTLSPQMKQYYEENPVFADSKGSSIVPDKFPTGEVGYKLFFFLNQYMGSTIDNKLRGSLAEMSKIEIFVEDENQWYSFDGVEYQKINRDGIALSDKEHTNIVADGKLQQEHDFSLRIKLEVEDIFKRSFPAQSQIFDIRNPVYIGMSTNANGEQRFDVLHKDKDGNIEPMDTFTLASEVRAIQESLNTLDALPYVNEKGYRYTYKTEQRFNNLLSNPNLTEQEKQSIKLERDIAKLIPFSFRGLTAGAGLPNYFGKPFSRIVEEVKNSTEINRRGDVDYSPTMLEIFYAFPDMPFNLLNTFEYEIASKKKDLESDYNQNNPQSAAKLEYEISLLEENRNAVSEAIRLFKINDKKKRLDRVKIADVLNSSKGMDDIQRPLFSGLLESIENQFRPEKDFPTSIEDFNGLGKALEAETDEKGNIKPTEIVRDEASIAYDILLDLAGVHNVAFGNAFSRDVRLGGIEDAEFITKEQKQKEDENLGFTPTTDSEPKWFDDRSRKSTKANTRKFSTMRDETVSEKEERLKKLDVIDTDYFIQNAEKELESVIPVMRIPIFQKYADLYADAKTEADKKAIISEIKNSDVFKIVSRAEFKSFIDRIKAVDVIRNRPDKVSLSWMNNQYLEELALQKALTKDQKAYESVLSNERKFILTEYFRITEQIRNLEIDNIYEYSTDAQFKLPEIGSLIAEKKRLLKLYNQGNIELVDGRVQPKSKPARGKRSPSKVTDESSFITTFGKEKAQSLLGIMLQEAERVRIHESFMRLVKLLAMGMPKSALNARMFSLEVLRKVHHLQGEDGIRNIWTHENLNNFFRDNFPEFKSIMEEDAVGDAKPSTGDDQSTVHPQDPIRRKTGKTNKKSTAFSGTTVKYTATGWIEYSTGDKNKVSHGEIINKYNKLASNPAGSNFTESQKRIIMQRHAASQLLADLGISRREYDPVLDSRVYVKLGLATESDSVDKIEIDDTPETQDIEAYHQAMLDLQKAMSEPVSYSFDDSVLQEIGVPEEMIASRPSRRDILKFIDEANEELDIQSSVAEKGKLALSVDQYNKMAKLDAVRNKLMEFTNTFFLAESKLHGANSDTGYFITPQMLALSIWSESSLSSAAQVEREASKDSRGGWNPIYQDNGLDAFVTADNPSVQDKTLAGWVSKEMDFAYARIGPQIGKFDENVVTLFDTVSKSSPVTAKELSKVLNAYYGFNLSEPLAESGKDLLEKFKKTGVNLSPYVNKILYKDFLEKAKSENQLKKTRLSSYAGNGIFMNDGGIVKRGRLNLIPGETYVKFIDLLINGAKNIKAEHVLTKKLGLKTNILRITQDGRVIQEIQYSNSKAMVEAYRSINQLTSAGDGFKAQLFALSGLDYFEKANQALAQKKVGARVIYKGNIHKIEEVKGEKQLVKADPDEVYRNNNGEYNYAILQTAFMMAFSKADPAAFYTKGAVNTVSGQPLDRAGISAVARDTQSLTGLSPDLVDAFSTEAGQGVIANINEDANDYEVQQDKYSDQDAPEVDNRKSNLQRLLSWIFGKQTLTDAFSRAGVRRKFRLNESMRRNLVSQGKHFLHSGFVNSYYELEEMNELMIEDLIKKGVVDPKNQAEMDSIRLNQKIRLYMGKTGVEIDEAKARYETPFMERLGDLKMDDPLHFFGNYVYARFAKVRNKYIREKYKKSPMAKGVDDEGNVLGSGMKDEEADRIMEATRNHPEFKKLNNIVKAFDRMNENTLEILVKGEVLSMDQYKRLKKAATNENGEFVWAPLRGFEKEMIENYPTGLDMIQELIHRDEVSGAQGTGSGFSQTGGRLALTAALGRTTKANAHEIWGNAFRGNLEAILRANKNKETSLALLELLKKVNSDEKLKEEWGGIFQIVRPIDIGKKEKKMLRLTYDPDLGEDRSYIQEIEVNAIELEDNVFTVRVRGEPVYIQFKGETGRRISDALKNKNNFQMGPFLRGLGTLSGFFSSLYTVWNLDFILTNFFRDFVSGVLNLKSDQETRDIANQIVNPRSMHDNFKGMYAVAKARRQGKTMDSVLSDSDRIFLNEVLQKERSDVTEEDLTRLFSSPEMTAIAMQKAGGKVEFFGLIDAEKKTSDIIRKLKNFNKSGKPFNERNAGAKFFDWVNDVNTGVENATRMQAFKVMVMNGATFQNAAYKGGREGTVDFNRKGNYTNVMNALFPFFGAGVAGNARLVRALMSPDMGGSKEFKQRLALKIIMGGFTFSLLMRAFAGEDEETEEQHWDRLSSWEKKHGLNVFLKPNGDGGRVVIPLPYGWNLLYGVGATMADFAVDSAGFSDRKYGAFEAASEVMTSAMDTFHPMSGGTGLGRVIPHAFRPAIYEIPFNRNFMGNPIRPEPNKFEIGKTPDSQLYFNSVNPISRDITNFINTATGGNEQQAGLIDVSPSSIDHLLGYFFGTMGRQIMTMSGFAYDTAKGKTPNIGSTRAIPVVSRLYKDQTKDYEMQSRFYDLREHTGGYFKRHKYLLDQGDTQGAREFFNKNRNALKVYSLVDAHTKRISKFKRDINKRKKSGISGSKIQPLEDRLQSERIRGMSSILKQARQLGIYL